MIEKIDIKTILVGKGIRQNVETGHGQRVDFTDESLCLLAEKINELVEEVNKLPQPLYVVNGDDIFQVQELGHVHESDGLNYLSNPVQSKCRLCGEFYQPNN